MPKNDAPPARGGSAWRKCSCCGNDFYWKDKKGDFDFTTSAMPEQTLQVMKDAGIKKFNLGGMDFGMVGPIVPAVSVPGDFVRFVEEHGGKVVGVRDDEVISAFYSEEDVAAFKHDLKGRMFAAPWFTGRCSTCEVRGGLCLHNIYERNGTAQEGLYHSSRVHPDPNPFADDPSNCPPCVAAKASAEWVSTLPELSGEAGLGVNWRSVYEARRAKKEGKK